MKALVAPVALIAATAVAVYFYPDIRYSYANTNPPAQLLPKSADPVAVTQQRTRPKIEIVFVLDTTGSMSGLIQAAKEKIWSIATNLAQAQPAPEIKMGLVAYRDRGDAYVTRIVELSSDLDSVYGQLMGFTAGGGGDGPESVNQALYEAINKVAWSHDKNAYRAVFLVGDAPPHSDYQDDVKYQKSLELALQKSIVVNTIQCGADTTTAQQWQQIAQMGQGQYFQVEQSGSAVAVSTPYDEKLADLAAQMDATRIPYGSTEERRRSENKFAESAKFKAEASVASQARRALFNATPSGKDNLYGDKELVNDVAAGRVDLSKVDRAALPAPLQAMAPAEQQTLIAGAAEKRKGLQKQIDDLGRQRADYLKEHIDSKGAAKGSLDEKLYGVVRQQVEHKGITLKATAPTY